MIRFRAIKERYPNGLTWVDYEQADFPRQSWFRSMTCLIDSMRLEIGEGTWYQVFLNFLNSCKHSVFYPILTSFDDWNSAYSIGPNVISKLHPQVEAIADYFRPDLSAARYEPTTYCSGKGQRWAGTSNRWLFASQMARVNSYSVPDLRVLLRDMAHLGNAVPGSDWEKSIAYGDRVRSLCSDYTGYLLAAYRLPPTWYLAEHLPEESWLQVLVNAGVLPQGTLPTARGTRCVAKDGHECHSLAEMHIDDWLYANEIAHEREPIYPEHPVYNPKGRLRADFKVDDLWIEYAGLLDDHVYARKIDKKKEFAIAIGLKLAILMPSDVPMLADSMMRYGIRPTVRTGGIRQGRA